MKDLLRSEWIKIRTVRVNYILGIIAAALPIVITALIAILSADANDVADDIVAVVTGTMLFGAFLFGVIGALHLTSEYSHNTIRVMFAAAPQRSRVLLAKAIVTLTTTFVLAAVIEAISFGIGLGVLKARDASVSIDGDDRAALVGAVVLACMLALLGYGLGLLIRNSPATVAIVILWPLVLENIARLVLDAAGVKNPTPWLPCQSAIGMTNPDTGPGDPSRLHGAIYLGAVILALIIAGLFVNTRRDA